MNNKRITGPWRVIMMRDGQITVGEDNESEPANDYVPHAHSRIIAVIARRCQGPENMARARLIAAAPDLLAACELFAELWHNDIDTVNAAGAIVAAIIKAKGETK